MRKRVLTALLILCLTAVCLLPMQTFAADLFFVAVNDSIPLTLTGAAPYSEGSTLYVPGTAFGASGEGNIRCSYATALELLNTALDRMAAFVKEIR